MCTEDGVQDVGSRKRPIAASMDESDGASDEARVQNVVVQPSTRQFYQSRSSADKSYPMSFFPRGNCLILNIFNIKEMPPRRWSHNDVVTLKQVFEQLMFRVHIFSDEIGHDMSIESVRDILVKFSQLESHKYSQCSVVCLMSHGEEGYLTAADGLKLSLEREVYELFSNKACPNLTGKPKLFFIQACRDDPVLGPQEDHGVELDESDGASRYPSVSDMLVGFPTQKGYIAYRKPGVGSWYMQALAQVLSARARDTDLVAMLHTVNGIVCNEATNLGKKQMSEYRSCLTKPHLYLFPGLYCLDFSNYYVDERIAARMHSGLLIPTLLCENSDGAKRTLVSLDCRHDGRKESVEPVSQELGHRGRDLVADLARGQWRPLGRALGLSEPELRDILQQHEELKERTYQVLLLWEERTPKNVSTLLRALEQCRLVAVRDALQTAISRTDDG